jgi:hypothetical protein
MKRLLLAAMLGVAALGALVAPLSPLGHYASGGVNGFDHHPVHVASGGGSGFDH